MEQDGFTVSVLPGTTLSTQTVKPASAREFAEFAECVPHSSATCETRELPPWASPHSRHTGLAHGRQLARPLDHGGVALVGHELCTGLKDRLRTIAVPDKPGLEAAHSPKWPRASRHS
eukprot:5958553-Amphidinium_carterae.1